MLLCGVILLQVFKGQSPWLHPIGVTKPNMDKLPYFIQIYTHSIRSWQNETKSVMRSGKTKWLMGLKVHCDGFKPVKSLDWRSAVASVR